MTRVAVLWHMHQPFYQDLATGEHVLPWVRFHGLKDYYGMVALLREFPGVKVTFNLVPSLLVQLEAFAREEARDRHLDVGLKPADALTEEERTFCLDQFFHAHHERMIAPYPRYAALLAKRTEGGGLSARSLVSQFSTDDLRDLQVWHKLAWLDPFYLDGDARVRVLLDKGRGFSEDDKRLLREIELELLRKVIPEYREAFERGQIELSTSPFYHPILPLLCDTDVYLRTHPHSRMPRERFRRPDDAAEQIARALALHERLFSRRSRGLWPSEGSVSDDMVPLVADAGLQWMATDEDILARTLNISFTRDRQGTLEQPEMLYRTYGLGPPGHAVAIVFRDHVLSDLIGFTYGSWSADFAADDFVRRLQEAGRAYTAKTRREATIAVILDGENAWEHYEGGGRPFLRAVYARLQGHPELRTVTMSEACEEIEETLPHIFPGSWINGDFYIWIGHEDDRRAWDQLGEARRAFDAAPAERPGAARDRAREELLIAEGSDWFWWYGDDHSSEHDLAFDDLFRRHVRNVYRALEKPIPEELFVTNITTAPALVPVTAPTSLIQPTIDGQVTSYFEWLGAGGVDILKAAGAMHPVTGHERDLSRIDFGADLEHLYVRMEGDAPMKALLQLGIALRVKFLKPRGIELTIRAEGEAATVTWLDRNQDGGAPAPGCPGVLVAAQQIGEVRIPFACLRVGPRDTVAFVVTLRRNGEEVGRYPDHQPIELEVPDAAFGAAHWSA